MLKFGHFFVLAIAWLPKDAALGSDLSWELEPFYCPYKSSHVLFISPEHPDFVMRESNLPWVNLSDFDYEELKAEIEAAIEARPENSDEFIVVPVTHVNWDKAMLVSIIVRDQSTEKWCPGILDRVRRERERQQQKQMWMDMSNDVG